MTPLPAVHLGYCTNIHAGESLSDVRAMLAGPVHAVKRAAGVKGAFGVGLRLAARAAYELARPGAAELARSELAEAGLYVFSLNGFPYGAFHDTRVKEEVYRPDWLEDERVRYARALARAACELLPAELEGSISTVPGAFAPRAAGSAERREIARNIATSAADLAVIERERGRTLRLALEPEPACLLETIAETVDFFENELCSSELLGELARATGTTRSQAEVLLRRHVGVCLDTCHASVEFESPLEALRTLADHGIVVPKIQLSAGLRLENASADALALLGTFADDVYLHQTVVRSNGALTRFLDLPEALSARERFAKDAEWRVHFHVPICEPSFGLLSSTQADLEALLLAAPELAPHLEVETYTFGVLPEAYRNRSVTESITRELAWVRSVLARREQRRNA
jgi:sugar phosphate isomerase/epimerase